MWERIKTMADKTYPLSDGIWAHDEYWYDIESYLTWCFDEDLTPDSSVEICRVRPFEMDANEVIERAYDVNEVDIRDDNGAPDAAAVNELQALLEEWAKKHLAHWSFPTGEILDISAEIAEQAAERERA